VGGCSGKKGCRKCWYSIGGGGGGGNVDDKMDRLETAPAVTTHGASGDLGFMVVCGS
jgi:hypothetical protein